MKSQSASVILQRIEARETPGIVDQAVDASEVFFDIGEEALDFGDVFEIGLKHRGVAAFGGGGAGGILRTAVMDGDAGA